MKLKRITALALTLALALTAAGCGGQSGTEDSQQLQVTSALEVLEQVWSLYEEEEKFPAAGGDYDHSVMDGPGSVDLSQPEMVKMMLYVTDEQVEQLQDAALLMHMMNANTFTAGALLLQEGVSAREFAQTLEESIQSTQWMCGFPERLLIVALGERAVVSAFGLEEQMTTFQTKLLEAYPQATVLFDEEIL